MATAKILISLPNNLASRLRAAIPPRKRSKVLRHLIEKEIERRERKLYECALSVENDEELNTEMLDWEVTTSEGIDKDESW